LILYLDTSALTKLYVEEAGSAEVRRLVEASGIVATARVAYPEARAALARRCREGAFSAEGLRRATAALDADLASFAIIELAADLAHAAGDLAETQALRGFDAVHLASALEFARMAGETPVFCCADDRLSAAAGRLGLAIAGAPAARP
jgi:predicted nucleic acid-binding protein